MARSTAAASDPADDVRRLLVELNLTTLARELSALLTEAESTSPGYTEFLRLALERELRARAERRVQRHLRWSRLGGCPRLDDFDFSARPQIAPQAVREWTRCRFVEERRNLIFLGRASLGKTTIAKAIGDAACRKGLSVFYTTLADMLDTLRAAKADGTFRKAFRRVVQPALLVVDDVGLDPLSLEQAGDWFRVVCARYRMRSTIVLANVPLKKWGDFLPCPAQAVALVDRLLHDATILRFTGKPFREPREILGAPLDDE